MDPHVLRTRRGLVLALYGDVVALATLLLFLALRRPGLIVAGFALAGFFALPSLVAMMRGRREFPRPHPRLAAGGFALFWIGAAAYVLVALALSTTFPQNGQLATLRIGLFLLAVALAAENLSGILFLWSLHPPSLRLPLLVQASSLALLLGLFLWRGLARVNDFVQRSGGVAVNPAEAASYLHDFSATVLVDFALAFLFARIPGLVALWRAIDRLAWLEAERRERLAVATALPHEADAP